MADALNRRTALKGAGGLGVIGLASACGAGGGDSAAAATQVATGPLAALADLEVGGTKVVVQGRSRVAISRTGADTVVAFSAICTHQGCTVKAKGVELDCPCHGSKFDATTGAVLHGPAEAPLAAVPVRIADGQVVAV
jgi:Rieske Fe-S protein